jgi:hypothetical protein
MEGVHDRVRTLVTRIRGEAQIKISPWRRVERYRLLGRRPKEIRRALDNFRSAADSVASRVQLPCGRRSDSFVTGGRAGDAGC